MENLQVKGVLPEDQRDSFFYYSIETADSVIFKSKTTYYFSKSIFWKEKSIINTNVKKDELFNPFFLRIYAISDKKETFIGDIAFTFDLILNGPVYYTCGLLHSGKNRYILLFTVHSLYTVDTKFVVESFTLEPEISSKINIQ